MRYEVRRISLRSTLRFALGVGGAIALLPAACLAGLAVQLIQRSGQALERLRGFRIELPSIETGFVTIELPDVPIDLVRELGLAPVDQTVQPLVDRLPFAFVVVFGAAAVVFALALALLALVFAGGYNLVAARAGGLRLELREVDERPISSPR